MKPGLGLPARPGAPSGVIQGFFPGGRPSILQPTMAVHGHPAVPAARPMPDPLRPAAVQRAQAPGLPDPFRNTMRPGSTPSRPQPGAPGAARPGAIQPFGARQPHAPRPIGPASSGEAAVPASAAIAPRSPQHHPATPPRSAAIQPSGGQAFAVPPGFALRPPGSGQRLPEAVQRKMEAAFGASFADVRVHVGPEAASIGALAFTIGNSLYFAPGQYNPQTPHGHRLLGHELMHVVQQRAGRVRNPTGAGVAVVQDPALEAEAERMGMRVATAPAPIQAKPAGGGPAVAPWGATRSGSIEGGSKGGAILPSSSSLNPRTRRRLSGIVPVEGAIRARSRVPDPFTSPLARAWRCADSCIQMLIQPGFVPPAPFTPHGLYQAISNFYDLHVKNEYTNAHSIGYRRAELEAANSAYEQERRSLLATAGGLESSRFTQLAPQAFNNLRTALDGLVNVINLALGDRDDQAQTQLNDYLSTHFQNNPTEEQLRRLGRQQREGTKVWLGVPGHRNQVRGFRSQAEADQILANLRQALTTNGVQDAQVAIRGSSVRGWNSDRSREYRPATGPTSKVNEASDLDFFFTSPSMEKKITSLGARRHQSLYRPEGNLHPDDFASLLTEADDPAGLGSIGINRTALRQALANFSKSTKDLIGRKCDVTLIKEESLSNFDLDDHVLV